MSWGRKAGLSRCCAWTAMDTGLVFAGEGEEMWLLTTGYWVVQGQGVGGKLYIRGGRAGRGRHVGCVGRLQGDKSCRFFVYLDEEREAGQRPRQAAGERIGCCCDLSFSPPLIMAIVYAGTNTFFFYPASPCLRHHASFSFPVNLSWFFFSFHFVVWRLIRRMA